MFWKSETTFIIAASSFPIGTEVLKMEVSRTCHVLAPVLHDSPPPPVYSGYLQRLSARSVTGRKWCRRWFAVKLDGVLYWYRTDKVLSYFHMFKIQTK